jgi:hypothetical protein
MQSMDDLHRLEAKGLARAKIRSKRRRVSAIRSRTIRGSLALFAITWAIVFGQLVTGNDPALSRTHSTRKLLTSTHRSKPAANVPVRPAPESEEESAVAPVVPIESEPTPEVESESEPAFEEVEAAPEPVITSAS